MPDHEERTLEQTAVSFKAYLDANPKFPDMLGYTTVFQKEFSSVVGLLSRQPSQDRSEGLIFRDTNDVTGREAKVQAPKKGVYRLTFKGPKLSSLESRLKRGDISQEEFEQLQEPFGLGTRPFTDHILALYLRVPKEHGIMDESWTDDIVKASQTGRDMGIFGLHRDINFKGAFFGRLNKGPLHLGARYSIYGTVVPGRPGRRMEIYEHVDIITPEGQHIPQVFKKLGDFTDQHGSMQVIGRVASVPQEAMY